MVSPWLTEAVSAFGNVCKAKLAGPVGAGQEAAIRAPLEALLGAAGKALGLIVVPHDETADTDRGVRPDYAISVNGAITGYVEVKKPGAGLDPESFTGHNLIQWQRQQDLPNLIYTNGTQWWLWRDGARVGDPVHLRGGTLAKAGAALAADDDLELLLTQFLRWKPAPITTVLGLVRAIAPLTRLLRGEVLDQLAAEKRASRSGRAGHQPFTGLASDWRKLLFPTADDETFADGYAQTVTFSLLLARTENIDLASAGSLHEIGSKLSSQHSLMARALQLLTDYVAKDFSVTLDLLVRVIGAVNWPRIRKGRRDAYLHLYESFLDEYDPQMRKQSGSYYTPRPIVEQMVRLTEDVLRTHLDRTGFADPTVITVDPAMGTGTYLHTVIDHVATSTKAADGVGAVAAAVTDLASRLYGFELQMGPFAVAELRATDLLAHLGATVPKKGLGLYVTNTLDDPAAEQVQLGSGLDLIGQSMRRANRIKAKRNVTVVIGNPPYRERAEGMGGWVENGSDQHGGTTDYRPLDDFRADGNGQLEYVLKNLYVYFWRWATWKVFDANRDLPLGDTGVVCFITTSGYLRGPGFKGMREYLRRHASRGWIIDVTPEGQRPGVPTRVFPGVQQPLAIGIFVRRHDKSPNAPAHIAYTAVHGRQAAKFTELAALRLDSSSWRAVRPDWQAPFTPAAESDWDEFPALYDLLPWAVPGVKANRAWVYAPHPSVLYRRWGVLREASAVDRPALFKDSRDSALDRGKAPLAGSDTAHDTEVKLASQFPTEPTMVRVGFRSFDRQWLIADSRVIDQPRPPLWAARIPGQVFVVEQHAQSIDDGPGTMFSALIPDMHMFNNRGGRALPLLHPGGSPNIAPGLLDVLSTATGTPVTADDVIAYIAAITAHPGFTRQYADELTTPGLRIPITGDGKLWTESVALGRQVIWLHTYGSAFADPVENRPLGDIRLHADHPDRVTNLTAVTTMPDTISYNTKSAAVVLGTGTFGPVPQQVWEYAVGGRNILTSWFNYRKDNPGGRRSSPLDSVNADSWPADWNSELIDLLTVLVRLVRLEPAQDQLLQAVAGGPLLTRSALASTGVTWPGGTNDKTRAPNYMTKQVEPIGQLGFPI